MGEPRSTRREYLTYSGALVAGGVLAGCTGTTDDESTASGEGMSTASDEEMSTVTETTPNSESYTVSMEPMGAVEFDQPPETWCALLGSYADMGFAVGAGQTAGVGRPHRYATEFYDELPGVSYEPDDVVSLRQDGTVDKELFYEIDADVHFVEPNQLINWYDWDEDDIAEIESNVGPFFGNFIRRRDDDWHQGYQYYSLYDAFEKVAEVFDEQERYAAFEQLHDDVIGDIEDRLPPAEDRPRAILLYPASEPPETFYPYRLSKDGASKKQWRDLGLTDALDDSDIASYTGGGSGEIDLEALLEIDPDVMLVRGQEQKTAAEFQTTVVDYLQAHSVASEITAVSEGAVYDGGYLDQGPIINLFQTEQGATNIYPEIFTEEALFDRQRVADIINGDFDS